MELDIIEKNTTGVIEGNTNSVQEHVQQALTIGTSTEKILKEGLISAMSEIGNGFETGVYFIPEMLISARAMKAGLALLRPYLAAANIRSVGKIVITTVQGDLHDIGKNLVGIMLEGAGFEVNDLGVDASPEKYVAAVKEYHPDLIGISALLTTTMVRMKNIIQALQDEGLRQTVKVMVGGAPVTEQFAKEIGADLYAPDAASAAKCALMALKG
jgi:5-methyltetrahydrofolate--homocysteine methyltransferase